MKQPTIIKSIWDNRGKTLDRFTIVLNYMETNIHNAMLCLSVDAVAFSQYSHGEEGDHLGDKIEWNDLNENLQQHIIGRV